MPSTIILTIIKARNLPRMERVSMDSNEATTKAYCVVQVGKIQEGSRHNRKRDKDKANSIPVAATSLERDNSGEQFITEVKEGSNPEWNRSFAFSDVDDEDLQEKFFEIAVQSGEKLIGTVVVDLGPLLHTRKHGEPMSDEDKQRLEAWFPIYNFEKGLRGDLKVQVKVNFIKDENPTKVIKGTDVEFFCQVMPEPSKVKYVLKFVEELIEFRRRPDSKELETMNVIESRSLRLKRKLARKVSTMGGNAVIGYCQAIDDEGVKS